MTYKDLLQHYIKKSSFSYREISRRCKEQGNPVSQAYISQLVSGDVPPASEEVSNILAVITGGDPEKLIWLGYIEKAPVQVQPLIKWYLENFDSYAAMVAYFHNVGHELSEEELKTQTHKMFNELKKLPPEQKIDYVISKFNKVAYSNPIFLKELGELKGLPKDQIESTLSAIRELPLNRIKVWNILEDKIMYEWMVTDKIRNGDFLYVIAPDNSMIGANIIKGSKVFCKSLNINLDTKFSKENVATLEIASGKICFVSFDDNMMLRRVFVNAHGIITLQAENPKYPPVVTSETSDLIIAGIVESVEFNPNA